MITRIPMVTSCADERTNFFVMIDVVYIIEEAFFIVIIEKHFCLAKVIFIQGFGETIAQKKIFIFGRKEACLR